MAIQIKDSFVLIGRIKEGSIIDTDFNERLLNSMQYL